MPCALPNFILYLLTNIFFTLFVSIQSKDKMMRGSRRGCVRLRVRFSNQILLTSVTNPYNLNIWRFVLVLFSLFTQHTHIQYGTFGNMRYNNNAPIFWRPIKNSTIYCFAEAISLCNVNVASGDVQTCPPLCLFCESSRVYLVGLNEPVGGSTSPPSCFGSSRHCNNRTSPDIYPFDLT